MTRRPTSSTCSEYRLARTRNMLGMQQNGIAGTEKPTFHDSKHWQFLQIKAGKFLTFFIIVAYWITPHQRPSHNSISVGTSNIWWPPNKGFNISKVWQVNTISILFLVRWGDSDKMWFRKCHINLLSISYMWVVTIQWNRAKGTDVSVDPPDGWDDTVSLARMVTN